MLLSYVNQLSGFASATPDIINNPLSLRRQRVFIFIQQWGDYGNYTAKEV